MTPSYALISVGKGNSYGHPTEGALTRLTAAGAKIFRTDDQGEITVVSDGKTLTFSTDPTTDLTPGSASKGSSSSGSSSSLSSSSSSSAVTTPSTTPSGGYVLNTHTKKFHLPTCSSVSQMKEKNRAYSNESRDQLISGGVLALQKVQALRHKRTGKNTNLSCPAAADTRGRRVFVRPAGARSNG